MGIKFKHGSPQEARAVAEDVGRRNEQRRQQAQQEEMAYKDSLRQQDLQISLEAESRSKMWEIEKMELRSRMDFEREERARQKKLAEQDAKVEALDNALLNGQISEEDHSNAVLQTKSGIPIYAQSQINKRADAEDIPSPSRQLGDINAAFELQGYTSADLEEVGLDPNDFPMIPKAGGGVGGVAPQDIPQAGGGMVIVQDEEGNIVEIPEANLQQAIDLGATLLSGGKEKKEKHSPAGLKYLTEKEELETEGRFGYINKRFGKTGKSDPVANYINKRFP